MKLLSDLPFKKIKPGLPVESVTGNFGMVTRVWHDTFYVPDDPDGDLIEIHWYNGNKGIHRHYEYCRTFTRGTFMAIEFINNSLIMNADRYTSLKKYDSLYLSNFDLVAIVFDKSSHGFDGIKVLKTRFWDSSQHPEVLQFDQFKKLCEEHILND